MQEKIKKKNHSKYFVFPLISHINYVKQQRKGE